MQIGGNWLQNPPLSGGGLSLYIISQYARFPSRVQKKGGLTKVLLVLWTGIEPVRALLPTGF